MRYNSDKFYCIISNHYVKIIFQLHTYCLNFKTICVGGRSIYLEEKCSGVIVNYRKRFRRRKLKNYEQAMPSAKQQRLCTHVKPRVIFTIEPVASLFSLLLQREIFDRTTPLEQMDFLFSQPIGVE